MNPSIAVDGSWSSWTVSSTCSADCGGGTQSRSRTCTEPQLGGRECFGPTQDKQKCNTQDCDPGKTNAILNKCNSRHLVFFLVHGNGAAGANAPHPQEQENFLVFVLFLPGCDIFDILVLFCFYSDCNVM